METRRSCCCCLVVFFVAVLVITITVVLVHIHRCSGDHLYAHAAVAADSETCSGIGRNILLQGGSAVDSAIAALLCTSIVNPQSMGIGGGSIFTIYDASKGNVTIINAREMAPQKVKPGLFNGCGPFPKPDSGSQWVAVPGELSGYWEAHQKFGKLSWKALFEPSIQLAQRGFQTPKFLKQLLNFTLLRIKLKSSSLSSLFYNRTGSPREIMKNEQLAKTLKIIAEQGPDAFYNGKIGHDLILDLQEEAANNLDGILTHQDLKQYKASIMVPLNVSVGDYVMYFPPLPSKGIIVSLILNILKGFKFSVESMEKNQRVQTYHRIIEALKFGNGQLSNLMDSTFWSNLLSDGFAESMRRRIDDQAHSLEYYDIDHQAPDSYGTSHVSVIDRHGNAVSVTSSINHLFGSMIFSNRTGIILNNQLADFCRSSLEDVSGKQPPSSMSPVILISQDRKSIMMVGSSGGSMIISAIAQIIMNKLWFGLNMKKAIEKKRLYVNSSNALQFEKEFDNTVIEALKKKDHRINDSPIQLMSVIQGIFKDQACIEAVSDIRKYGKSAGY
ncbi:glutathione hydrolase 5 proenzyme-like isoform X2 [Stegostoma tigrinum]|uniref:glutathione hydrolase 5 proenzyme-like isoform X2 n=1 Tax=Stegostoma tigrinum TaxID=3053191 RepID=UPI0028704860|nr:glutathione hydrolase 5 proenzyme-like isoform X2 [Stegostoma tigrinum]